MPGDGQLIVIDENLSKRLRTELRNRGRNTTTVKTLHLRGFEDPNLLPALDRKIHDAWVLVTADDAMPEEHGDVIGELGLTVATLHPWGMYEARGFPDQESYKREVVHRWAHRMAHQDPGQVRRYSPYAHRLWTPRRT